MFIKIKSKNKIKNSAKAFFRYKQIFNLVFTFYFNEFTITLAKIILTMFH